MKTLIIILLVLWLGFSLVGILVEGLLWLLWIGILLFVATAAWGLIAGRKG
ncbi:hypothetical protein [Ornithinimicrobium pratense]|uniref:hypothetical protein n=1 Tax=Ornithinimicrobium pratense TaxID=2593973 RepID=UPI001788870A|nr:hypothetical protein [Ornithinimicrobium pratense]